MCRLPFISVIVPTHNRLPVLQQLVDCLISQDYPSECFEILIVDDGSTDGTQAFLQHGSASGKIRHAVQSQRGPGAARNLGAQMAQGEVLAFTDSDCMPEPGWLTALAGVYALPGVSPTAAVGGRIENFASGSWLRKFQARRGSDHIANHQPTPLYLDTANALFSKAAFLSVGGFNSAYTWSEDVDLGFRLRRAGIQLITTPDAVVWHVGTSSLVAYLKRSYRIGYAKCRLASDYPDVFFPLPSNSIRLSIRNRLDQLSRLLSQSTPDSFLYKLSFRLSRLLYYLAQFLTWEKAFWTDTLPHQYHHFRSQQLNGWIMSVYLNLECVCHLAQLAGVAAYYRKVSLNVEPLETFPEV